MASKNETQKDGEEEYKREKSWERKCNKKKRDPTYLLHAPLCPMDPVPCSAVTLMKSRPQSLSIWPVCPSPVKGNRLAEQRHYITICRCRRARQRREERHCALGERKGLWHPSLSHLGWRSTTGEKHTPTDAHTHRLGPGISGRARKREVREDRKVEEKWNPSLPSKHFFLSHFMGKKGQHKRKRECILCNWGVGRWGKGKKQPVWIESKVFVCGG